MEMRYDTSSPHEIARTTVEFGGEDEEERNWVIDPVTQKVTYSGEIIETDFDATGRRLHTTLSNTKLTVNLPFDFLLNQPWLPEVLVAAPEEEVKPVVLPPPPPPSPPVTAGASSSAETSSNAADEPATSMEAAVPDVESP